jgi:Fic family protein
MNQFDDLLIGLPEAIWRRIAKIDELKGNWHGGARLSPQVLGRLKRSVLVTSTGASTRIEGAKLSDGEIESLMRGIVLQRFSDRDKQEVKGYFELLNNVFESWEQLNFGENLIKHFHQQLLKHVDKDQHHRGEYKKQENQVVAVDKSGRATGILFDTTSSWLTPKEMQELVDWVRSGLKQNRYHPLLIIGVFVIWFLKIHPFVDGNGRLSRILTNLLMLQSGYTYMPYASHERLIEEHKTDYYLALRQSQKTFESPNPSVIHWLEYFLEMLLIQVKAAVTLLSGENIDKLLSPLQLKVWRYIEKVNLATPKDLAEKLKIARPTINQILNRLLALKKIERLGMGRSSRYRKL